MGKLVRLNTNEEAKEQRVGTVAAQGKSGRLVRISSAQGPRIYATGTRDTAQAGANETAGTAAGSARSGRSSGGRRAASAEPVVRSETLTSAGRGGQMEKQGALTRLKNLTTGAAKDYAASMAGAAEGLLSAPAEVNYAASGIGKQNETAREWIETYTAQLADAKTEEERKRLENLIALNEKRLRVNDERAESASRNYIELTEKPREALQDTYRSLNESAQRDIATGKAGLSGVGRLAADVGVAGAQMLGDITLGAATGGGALLPMAARVYGGSTQEAKAAIDPNAGAAARLEGEARAQLYGAGSAALSVATEKLSSVAAPFKKAFGGGVLDKAIDHALAKMNGSAQGKLVLSFLSEGGEEVMEDLVQPLLQSIYNGKSVGENYSELELSDVLYDGLVGGILGGLGSGVEIAADKMANRGDRQAAQQAAQDTRDITEQLIGAGATEAEAQALAPALEAVLNGEEISGNQAGAIAKNEAAVSILENATGEAINTDAPLGEVKTTIRSLASRQSGVSENTGETTPAAAQTQQTASQRSVAAEQDAVGDGKRIPLERYATEENIDSVSRELNDGTLAVDAEGRVYRPEASEHIDQRTSDTVGERRVNAFQFDHPEMHSYYREAAAELLEELHAAEKGGEIVHVKNPGPGEDRYFRTKRLVSDRIAQLLDGERLSYDDIERALTAIINNHGQENFAAAKRVELMLDDMLTKGYRSVYGEDVAPNEDYLTAKQAVPGAQEQTHEELPIWDVAEPEEEVSRETAARRAAQVRSAAAALGQNGSRALSSIYDENTARSYAPEDAVRDFYQVYNAALNDTADSNTTAPDYLRLAARNAGERDARVSTQAKYFGENAGLVRDASWKKANLTSRESYTLDALGKVTGTEIRFADTVENGRANASYRDGVMTLALDAKDPVMVSAVHETVHRLRETSAEAYTALADFVQSNLSEESTAFNLSKRAELYGTGDVDVLTEETVADAFGQMLEKSDVLERFAAEHRSAARKLMDALHDFVVKIKRALNGGEVRLSDNQRAAFRDLADKVGKMESLFVEALETAQGKALQGEADGATMTTMRNSLKEDRENGREEAHGTGNLAKEGTENRDGAGKVQGAAGEALRRGTVLRGTRGLNPSFGEKPYRAWTEGKTVEPVRDSVAYAEQQTAMEYGVPSFVVSDEAWAESGGSAPAFSAGGQIYFKETLPEKNRGMFAPHEITHVMRQVGYAPYLDFVERTPSMLNMSSHITLQMLDYVAKHQHTTLEAANPTRLYDEFNAMMYGHIAAGKAEMFISGVGTGAFHDFAAYAEELTAIHEQFKQHNRKEAKFSLKTDSEGRKLTEGQEEYFRESKVRDKSGNLLTMYHGTSNSGFTVFNTYGGKFGLFGMGSYFTADRSVAESYTRKGKGENPGVYEVYLNITNPLDMDANADLGAWREAFRAANLDESYLSGISTNEGAFRALKENLADELYYRYEAEDIVTDMIIGMGYDGITHIGGGRYGKKDGPKHRVYIIFDSNQAKNINNKMPTEDADIRYSRSNRELLDKYVEQYGEIPSGEKPHRTVRLPLRTAEDKYVSRTIRTVLEAKATPDAMVPTIEDMVADGKFSYDRYTDKQAVADAESRIKTQGWQKTLNQWKRTTKSEVSKEAMATGWALYNNAATSGDVETALEVLNDMVAKSRNAAQALQAVRILKQQDPSTQLYGAQRSVESLQEELKKQYGKNAPELEIDRALAEKFLNAKTDKARTEALGEIYRDIGRQMPSRFIDKWNAWRYLAMLGNPRTHVRNIMGNAGFAPLVGVKNLIGTGLESAANAASGGKVGRTKSVLTTKDTDLIKAAWNDYANIEDQALGEGKYDERALARKEIEAGRKIFGTTGVKAWDGTVGKGLEKFRRFNSAALDTEDVWFSKPHYASALAQYCKANGITAKQIASGKGLEAARNYAIREAQKATYRDTNAFSEMVSRMGRANSGNKNSAEKLGSTILEGVLPFRKTPANILVRGVEYSPIELLKSISYDLVQVKKGKMEATEMLDHLSTGLTGTGVMVLGAYMAAEGLMGMKLRGNGGDDEDKKDFDELRGHQDYSLELSDGTSITLDWLAPEVLPLFVGVNLAEQMQERSDGELTIGDTLEAVSNVSDPLLEMSCLQSLNDLFDSVGYAASGETSALASVIASAATSYLTQALPTLFGQIERTGEDTRMTTYTDKNNKWLTGDMQYALGKASSRLPAWDYNQIPYIDAWGRTESSRSVGERAFNNFLNPAYTSSVESSATEDELERLYEATGEKSVLPDRAERYFTVDGERKDLTGEEYVKYATARGQTAYRIISELVSSSAYRALDESDKAEAVKDAYSVAKASAKMQVSGYKPSGKTAKCIEAKQKYGIDEAQYILLYQAQSEIESLKDKDGETIKLSEGLLKMELVYQQKGLSDAQRTALFEAFNVPKSIRHYNKALVTEKLKAMRRKRK